MVFTDPELCTKSKEAVRVKPSIDLCSSSIPSHPSDAESSDSPSVSSGVLGIEKETTQEIGAGDRAQRVLLKATAHAVNGMLRVSRYCLRGAKQAIYASGNRTGIGSKTTVLVTTGRQAKTLHTVRALKSVGCRVIVSDYCSISTSAVSVDCDEFVQLSPLSSEPREWVSGLRRIIEKYEISMVLPVSTINEVLPMALAKDTMSLDFPNVRWICPGLEDALALDDRVAFSLLCEKHDISTPVSGLLTSREEIQELPKFRNGFILKRVESTVNRAEEVVPVRPGENVPDFISPTRADPWQWQEFITGTEMSVWYLCVDGLPCFTACYNSKADLTHFDPSEVPDDLDCALRRMISARNLSGQYAFDFIVDDNGVGKVLECNPRSSSILETVSTTPNWGEAFFGIDVTQRTVTRSVGFVYHKNSWPWTAREEGHWQIRDPLPIFAAQVAWPMYAIASRSSHAQNYKIDANICKIIENGQSPGRNIAFYRDELRRRMVSFAEMSCATVDTLLLDVSLVEAERVARQASEQGTKVIFLHFEGTKNLLAQSAIEIPAHDVSDAFFQPFVNGETRALFGEKLARASGSIAPVSYRVVTVKRTLHPSNELPLRRRRILHLMGSRSSDFYAGVSKLYGSQCVEYFRKPNRYEHYVAYVHRSGKWSIGLATTGVEYFECKGREFDSGEAMKIIKNVGIDVVLPHMFDYIGMTSYRSLFDILGLPIIGCTGEAMALSTNKVHTKAVAATSNVPVAEMEVLVEGQHPTMSPPFIIKPVEEDNSIGVSLVRSEEEIIDALEKAFMVDNKVMCERYIELGRELRVAVLENANGDLEMLPILEYLLPENSPIRGTEQKLVTNKKGVPNGIPKKQTQLPAEVDNTLYAKLKSLVTNAHQSLGCRDYSIYDVRVDPDGEPIMLESCLYCSFSPNSVIVTMARAAGVHPNVLFDKAIDWALTRRPTSRKLSDSIGMKS